MPTAFLKSAGRFVQGLVALLFLFAAPAAYAACASPAGAAGEMIYSQDWRVIQYCDGTTWRAIGQQIYAPSPVNVMNASSVGATYLNKASDFTGNADGTKATGSFWFRRLSRGDGSYNVIYCGQYDGANCRWEYSIDPANKLIVKGSNSAGTPVLDIRGSTAITDTNWHHALISFDLTDTAKRFMYLDDVAETLTVNVYNTAGVIDFTRTSHSIFESTALGASFRGDFADFWMSMGTYLDLSTESNRRKFIDASGNPVYLGATGNVPTGSSPIVFLSGQTAGWPTNKGTGAGFTLTGTLNAGAFGPKSKTVSLQKLFTFSSASMDNSSRLAVSGNYAYVTSHSFNTFAIVDISDPLNLTLKGSLTNAHFLHAGHIFIEGNYAYVGVEDGIVTVDISNPASPSEAAFFSDTSICSDGDSCQIAVSGDYIYAQDIPSAKVYVISKANPLSLSVVTSINNPDTDSDRFLVDSSGQYLYVPSWALGNLSIVDIRVPTAPVLMGSVNTTVGNVMEVAQAPNDPNYVYVGSSSTSKFAIINVSNKSAPSLVGTVNLGGTACPQRVLTKEKRLYVVSPCSAPYLYVFDITTPSAPVWLTHSASATLSCTGSFYCSSIGLSGDYIYTTETRAGGGLISWKLTEGCLNPNGSPGDLMYNNVSKVLQFCNGVNWMAAGPVPGAGGSGCAGPTGSAGNLIYNSDFGLAQYCDGTNWIAMGRRPATNLDGYWKLDDMAGMVAADSSGGGRPAYLDTSFPAAPWTAAGQTGGALNFDGVDDYISVQDANPGTCNDCFNLSTPFLNAENAGTFMAWVKSTDPAGNRGFLGTLEGRDKAMYIYNGQFLAGIFDGTTTDHVGCRTVSGGTVDAGWHHVAFSWNVAAGDRWLYVDGLLADYNNGSPWVTVGAENASAIGWAVNSGSACATTNPGYWQGAIDDVRVYTRTLSAADIAQIYTATGGVSPPAGDIASNLVAHWKFNEAPGSPNAADSAGAATGTLNNGANFTVSGQDGNALTLDGVNDYVDLGNPAALQITGSMTIAVWVKLNSIPVIANQIISESGFDGNRGWNLFACGDCSPKTWFFNLSSNGLDAGVTSRESIATLTTNWTHVAVVYDSTTPTSIKMFINGVLDNGTLAGAAGTVPNSQFNSTYGPDIGNRPAELSQSNYFPGLIDDLRVYNRALSEADIKKIYTSTGGT